MVGCGVPWAWLGTPTDVPVSAGSPALLGYRRENLPRETGCLMVWAPCGCVRAWLALTMLFDFSRGSDAVKVPLRWSRYLLPTP